VLIVCGLDGLILICPSVEAGIAASAAAADVLASFHPIQGDEPQAPEERG
jgi:hypothetical protein